MSSESTFYTDSLASQSWTTQAGLNSNVDTAWRTTKFITAGWSVTTPGGTSATISIGGASSVAFGNYAFELYTSYLRFDTSALGDDEEITGAHLAFYPTSIFNTTGVGSGFEKIIPYAGITGGSDRPTFSSAVSNPTDFNWLCETAAGCSSGTCSNEGIVHLGDIPHSDLSAGSTNTIAIGESTSYNTWVNRTGYTYITLTHAIWAGDESTYHACSHSNEAPYTPSGSQVIGMILKAGTSGDGPKLIINQGKTKFQMII